MESNISKSAMLNGLIIGFLLSVKFLLSVQKQGLFVFFGLVISVLIIVQMYLTTVRFRETESDGFISYGQAFKHLFLLYMYGAIISTLVVLIYTKFINSGYLEEALNNIMKVYSNFKIPIDDQTYKVLETIYKPISFSFLNLFSSLFTAAFWGLILAGFIKKNKSIFDQESK